MNAVRTITTVAAVLFLAVGPLSAISPSMLMFYGGELEQPIVVRLGNPSFTPAGFLWNPVNGGASYANMKGGTVPGNLEGRRYVSFAIFWGTFDVSSGLKPTEASQHGRVYLPRGSEPPVIVVTAPNMANAKDLTANPEPTPVPTSLGEFIAGWPLTPEQTAQLRGWAAVF